MTTPNNTPNADNNERDLLARMQKEAEDRAALNAAREQEDAESKLPPMVCLGKIPGCHAAMFYANKSKESKVFRYKDLTPDNLRAMTEPDAWREFLNPAENKMDKQLFILAKDYLLDMARESKAYNPLYLRRGGLWEEIIDGEHGLIWNSGSACFFLPHEGGDNRRMRRVNHLQSGHVYDSMITERPAPADSPLSYEDGRKLLSLFQARQWELRCAGELYLGVIVNGVLSGVVDVRPNMYVVAPSTTGKTELRKDTRRALGDIALHFLGTKTSEGAVRRDCDGNAQLALNDEFVKNGTKAGKEAASARMETMRGSHDSEDGIVKLCDENKSVHNYVMLNSFICYATAFPSEDPQDTSRFLVLRLVPWTDEEKRRRLWAEQEEGRKMVTRPGFSNALLMRIMWEYPCIRENTERLIPHLQKKGIKARRAVQMAHVLAGAHAVTHGGMMDEQAMDHALAVARMFTQSEMRTQEALEYLETLFSHVIVKNATGHKNVRQLCRAIMERLDNGESERGFWAQETIQAYGMSWSKKHNSLMIKIPLHPELQELYENYPQWAGSSPDRIVCAGRKENPNSLGLWRNESANVNGARCNALCVPRALIGSSTEQIE